MDTEIFITILSFAGTCIGTIAGIVINTKLSNYRIEQLEKKVEKHNDLIDRQYKLESQVQEIKKDVTHIYHELDEIKK